MKTTNLFLTGFIYVAMIQIITAQCPFKKSRFPKKDFWEVQVGAGLLPTFLKDRTETILPPVLLGVDYRLTRNFSLGLQIGTSVSEASRKRPGNTKLFTHRNHYTTIGLWTAAHTISLAPWEVYGGMMAGYGVSRVEVRENNQERSAAPLENYQKDNFYLSAFLGGRYAIARNIGVFSELGLGISLLSFGISWRFQ